MIVKGPHPRLGTPKTEIYFRASFPPLPLPIFFFPPFSTFLKEDFSKHSAFYDAITPSLNPFSYYLARYEVVPPVFSPLPCLWKPSRLLGVEMRVFS